MLTVSDSTFVFCALSECILYDNQKAKGLAGKDCLLLMVIRAGTDFAQQQHSLQQEVLVTNELLRHFWASIPCSTPARESKAKRIVGELQMQQAAVLTVMKQLNHHMAPAFHIVMQPTLSAAHIAQQRLESDQSNRARIRHARLLTSPNS